MRKFLITLGALMGVVGATNCYAAILIGHFEIDEAQSFVYKEPRHWYGSEWHTYSLDKVALSGSFDLNYREIYSSKGVEIDNINVETSTPMDYGFNFADYPVRYTGAKGGDGYFAGMRDFCLDLGPDATCYGYGNEGSYWGSLINKQIIFEGTDPIDSTYSYHYYVVGNADIVQTVAPEPTTLSLFGLASLGGFFARRKRLI